MCAKEDKYAFNHFNIVIIIMQGESYSQHEKGVKKYDVSDDNKYVSPLKQHSIIITFLINSTQLNSHFLSVL